MPCLQGLDDDNMDELALRQNDPCVLCEELIYNFERQKLDVYLSPTLSYAFKNYFDIWRDTRQRRHAVSYFTEDYLGRKFKKKIIYPKLSLGDVILFDPNNFFHIANKPKDSIRVILYIEFLGPKNKNLFNKVKIYKSIYKNLNLENKKLCSLYQRVS